MKYAPIFLLMFFSSLFAIQLPQIFNDHMVLQRETGINIWGKADPGEQVRIHFVDVNLATTANADGEWRLQLPPMPAGGPFDLSISTVDSTIIFTDVLLGDVWLASGQSNMEMSVQSSHNAAAEIAAANYPEIRLFTVQRELSGVPEWDVTTTGWQLCSPQSVSYFSAAAYFFGRDLYEHLHVPIGLVHSSWGGTLAEAWTSANMLQTLPDFYEAAAKLQTEKPDYKTAFKNQLAIDKAFNQQMQNSNAGIEQGVHLPTFDDSAWQSIRLPGKYQSGLKPWYEGFVWFRLHFQLSAKQCKQDAVLHLGQVDERDVTFVNGHEVGATTDRTVYRQYTIPKKWLQPGDNVLAVQVIDMWGDGGFPGVDDSLYLSEARSGKKICALAGDGKLQIDIEPALPKRTRVQDEPASLFNGMIAPLIPYSLKGFIWYQGESNAGRPQQYATLFPSMIEDWRMQWGQGYVPFLFVQLANYQAEQKWPSEGGWAGLREAQLHTLHWPKTGMAVIIDIGEAANIHPLNKQDVGKRLALAAKKVAYGEELVYSGPIFTHAEFKDNKVVLHFEHCGSGLTSRDAAPLTGFAIAGQDQKFLWADAEIDGDTIIVSHPDIAAPAAVRYGWATNPVCNLYNKEGLPASPFRTDTW